jgi:hypothetical protein
MTTGTWTPKVGDPVRYVAKSQLSGRLANVRGERIKKITSAGYITVTGAATAKFKVGDGRQVAYEARVKKFGSSMLPVHLEPVSEEEWAKLPHDNMAGSAYARALNNEQRTAEAGA